MSYHAEGNGTYQEPPEEGATSLSSQMNLYDSELASQPQGENAFYRDGNQQQFSRDNNHVHEQLHYVEEQYQVGLASTLPRSSPIAIQRASDERYRDIESHTSEEEDDSDIDVEGDAIKLRRKYGNKIIQTYVADSTLTQSAPRRDNSSVLNAPYLGSLSKSSNQVLSLPPMSLAGDNTFLGEPPESIVSYGSLRDSHERGRFLDGPSSYREPMSGKIRQLDHRLRYHGRQPPELNIGERLQQSLKQKELRLKREKNAENNNNNNINNKNDDGDRKETTSSLSAMMADASKNTTPDEGNSFLKTERLVPIQNQSLVSPLSPEHRRSVHDTPPRGNIMLSTSLTAFELLQSSNTPTFQRSTVVNPSTYSATFAARDARQTMDFANASGFTPLARSMSDPSPRFQNLSLSEQIPNVGLAAQMADLEQHGLPLHLQQQQQHQQQQHLEFLNGSEHRSRHLDHDPNTDGAFGDMDL
mmetsp:Transcript_10420/g.26237  ORF Transcript_10420/g.26237 Transcript_10420/m.26237 type:complete len:472 (-) Transcript_10420:246-1661(-)